MTNDIANKPIDELEVSVRAFELLSSLGVETVGELVARPRIDVPNTWPTKMARMVAAEIVAVLEELGLEYRGQIVVPSPLEAKLKATGTVEQRWATIHAWLATSHPHVLEQWRKPATEEAIAAAETALGITLPADYRAFLKLHDGQEELAAMVGDGSLLPVAKLAAAKANMFGDATRELDPEMVGHGVRPIELSPKWIPIAVSARGRDKLCLDLDPAYGGQVGQIVEYIADAAERPLVATSFADLLSKYFEQAQTGELDLGAPDDDDDDD